MYDTQGSWACHGGGAGNPTAAGVERFYTNAALTPAQISATIDLTIAESRKQLDAANAWKTEDDARTKAVAAFEAKASVELEVQTAKQAVAWDMQKTNAYRADSSIRSAGGMQGLAHGAPPPATSAFKPQHATNMCLNGGAAIGSALNIMTCDPSSDNQKWRFDANGRFVNTKTGLCADMQSASSTAAAPAPFTPIVMRACDTATRWLADGSGPIRMATWNDVCLDVEGGSSGNGARAIAYPCHGQANQRFLASAPSASTVALPVPVSTSTDTRCGPDYNTRCPSGQCCSIFGWCGGPGSEHCGVYKREDSTYHG